MRDDASRAGIFSMKHGAGDGARTRDLRRDRPVESLAFSSFAPNPHWCEAAGATPKVGTAESHSRQAINEKAAARVGARNGHNQTTTRGLYLAAYKASRQRMLSLVAKTFSQLAQTALGAR